jgi:hypothetical protein
MGAPELIEAALELADAASDVVASWEAGDLALAVRWLDEALCAFNATYSQSTPPNPPSGCDGLDGSTVA